MRPDPSRLGANVGFGYLTDDDDDDATGGAGADEFDALFASYDATRDVSQSSTFTLAISANSAQTNGSVVVTVTEPSSGAVTISTAGLDGWTQSGWSHAGTTWTNTLTKASVSAGTTGPSFTFSSSVAGTVTLSTASSAPHTTEATGSGQSVTVTVSATATLDFSATGSPNPVSNLATSTWSLYVVVGGAAQTGVYAYFYIRDSSGNNVTLNGPPSTVNLDGFTLSWTSIGDGEYQGVISRASCPIGTYLVQFTAVAYKHAHTDVGIEWFTAGSNEVAGPGKTNGYVSFS